MIDFNKNQPVVGSKWQTNIDGIVLTFVRVFIEPIFGKNFFAFSYKYDTPIYQLTLFDINGKIYYEAGTSLYIPDLKITGPYNKKSCLNCKRYRKGYCDLLGTYVDSKMDLQDTPNDFYCNKHELDQVLQGLRQLDGKEARNRDGI